MNAVPRKVIGAAPARGRFLSWGDVLILIALIVVLFAGLRLASPTLVVGPDIDLSPASLPWYTMLSLGRLTASYVLSILFSLVYGYIAARSRAAERIMLPVLDVLQSVPILSFLPVVVLSFTAVLPQGIAVELSAVILILTCQAWNIAYSFFQSMLTMPRELNEVSTIFRFNWWYRFRHLELPFSAPGLIWNSVVSWANGWFFLIAAETFQVNSRDFRLPGLGSYLKEAANRSDTGAIIAGALTLVFIIVLLDQLVWRPLLTWAEKFKIDMSENDEPPTSWFFDLTSRSRLANGIVSVTFVPLVGFLDRRLGRIARPPHPPHRSRTHALGRAALVVLGLAIALLLGYGFIQVVQMLLTLPLSAWGQILNGTLATALRIALVLIIALVWTVPVGVLIGTNPRVAKILQPIVQVMAAIPATALFPVLVLVLVNLPFGLSGAAVLFMLLGVQWYVLFNVIAGASNLPQDLRDVTKMFRIDGWARWRTLILPALFPYIVTGLIAAAGGAWNASVIAEYTEFSGKTYSVAGLGSIISHATAEANYPMLVAATLTMIIVVIAINRYFWNRLYRLAEEKYRLDA